MLRFLGFIIFLFQFQFLNAQESSQEEHTDTAFIFVDRNVVVFSKDESFNKKLRYKEAALSEEGFEKSHSTAQNSSSKNKQAAQDLTEEVRLTQEKKKQITLEEVKLEIQKFERKNKSSLNKEFYPPQSSDKFSGSKSNTKDYIAPKPSNQNVCKQVCFLDFFLIKKALGFLHTQKFFYYNNKSFDDCFSNVFSVRPPPIYS
ncbi:hypothetical protein MQX03_13820 [Chryseobacterium aahli]|uniref:hypothetical protein n=1 Tax=Chryseobacterium aahli TaxID=1278643 RepID=UPI001F61AB5E|nr:hypothetical protein [Chryseobacterium aahli]MCI3938276.1 hypothetical protein [Chryseobacterium aahli]